MARKRYETDRARFDDKKRKKIYQNWQLYLLLVAVIVYYLVFHYAPMYGVLIAFKDYFPGLTMSTAPWIGLDNFRKFFNSYYFERVLTNTVTIRVAQIIIGFPAPIILAILLNELSGNGLKKTVQNLTFIPHFLSSVVIVSILTVLCQYNGLFNSIRGAFGKAPVIFLQEASYFKPLFVLSGVWQNMGWNSMIYIGAIVAIDPSLYEAASIDGASRIQKIIHITLPAIMPTIIVVFLMNIGSIMNVGFDKVLLMQNDLNREASDIISTFVYERGILEGDYGLSTAVGLFNSLINTAMLLISNRLTKKVTGSGLW